jgi:peptidoglycan/xylan/chitin deacetylase (PgdA/CDA1 family)
MTEPLRRWQIKKAARKGAALASMLSGSMAVRRLLGEPRVRVLTYHRFGQAARDPWCVEPAVFEAQMRWLAEQRLALSLDDVLAFARGERDARPGSVLVTMDDGFRSVLTVAQPILERYKVPAVAYVTTSALGNRAAAEGAGEAFLEWDELRELDARGMSIGSHGHTHSSMAKMPEAEARDEGRRSRELLEDALGKPVTSFAYAYGMRHDESPATARILADCGYRSVFISQHGTIRRGADPLRLPRIKVEAGESLAMFKLLCGGAMDVWSLADRIR